jgi:hypothetical protein
MKKLRILVLLMILNFSFSVKADVWIEIDCKSNNIESSKSVSCDGTLLYGPEGINDIEFEYNTNLNIEFNSIEGFTLNKNNNKISIHSNTTLYDEIINVSTIFSFNLTSNNNCLEKEKLIINNIRINKSNDYKIDNVTKEFNVIVEPVKLDNISTLDSISIDKVKIDNFNKDKLEYHDINVTSEYIFIDAVRTSNKSSATGLGTKKVLRGETKEYDITVTAEDNSKTVYKLFITNTMPKEEINLDNLNEIGLSKDNYLKSLEIYNMKNKINIDFDKEKKVYNIDLDETVDKLTIKATLNDSKASFVKSFGPRDIKLVYGLNKELIKIKSENGEERVITININYIDKRDNDNSLLSLKINDKLVDLEKLEIFLPNDITKTNIEAIPKSDKAIVKYENIDLSVGNNLLTILVTSENEQIKEYKITIIREDNIDLVLPDIPVSIITKTKVENKVINIISYIFFGISFIAFIMSIIYFIKKKSKNYI